MINLRNNKKDIHKEENKKNQRQRKINTHERIRKDKAFLKRLKWLREKSYINFVSSNDNVFVNN